VRVASLNGVSVKEGMVNINSHLDPVFVTMGIGLSIRRTIHVFTKRTCLIKVTCKCLDSFLQRIENCRSWYLILDKLWVKASIKQEFKIKISGRLKPLVYSL
jgi:hypothetical protein